ncbi:hypothetical protein [Deinococcus marmoris]|uniref:hypothetical protein n=1 Tax=Deinococcus marmoris TaxID=249408 RepID=UPI00158BDD76|nr:hypothetical protein [Deinococcus marmoris]
MKKWEDLYIKVQETEAINSNISHLLNVLEHDNFWIDRHKLTGKARNQIEAFEVN